MITLRFTRIGVAVLATFTLALTGCGSKPKPGSSSSGAGSGTGAASSGTGATNASFTACMVTDTGGIDDKSFNASAWQGMQAAQSDGKAKVSFVQSKTETDYTTNIANELSKKCGLIVTVGGLMQKATDDAAKAHPQQKFAEVDAAGNGTNVKGLQYNTAQAAFLGGYLAASYSKSGKVATYGGLKISPVTIYMDGFVEGVQYFNQHKHKNVQVLGWNESSQNGSFAGSFTDQTKGQQLATNFMQQGADVIFPVAGGTGLGSAAAVKATNGKAVAIWVDTDGCVAAPQYCGVFLTSVVKNIAGSVKDAVEAAGSGQFNVKDYVGTLANGGTALSPFHDFTSKVPPTLVNELKAIGADIASGKITLKSPSQPKAGS